MRRTMRRLVSWRPPDQGVEPLDIGELVSPLRYDVVARAEFFRFLDAHLDLYHRDFANFSTQAREQPYFAWFERVAMARFRPWVTKDRMLLLEQYDERIRRSHTLWMSFQRTGFDPRRPVSVRRMNSETPTESGLRINRSFQVGDGCHRLALLLATDQRLLPPSLYRIERSPLRIALDNTAVLVRAPHHMDERSYARYLSLGYADREYDDLAALVHHVREHRPGSLDELRAVIATHSPTWSASLNARLENRST
jgi:hypothetical protein